MATLSLLNNFELDSNGVLTTGKQGTSTDAFTEAYTGLTVTGTCHYVKGSLATATVVTVYDHDDDVPADWDYLYLWCDGTLYLQVITAATNFIVKIAAKCPFVLPGFDSMLAAASTTAITGGAEPVVADIDSIVLGNYSGSSVNYVFCVID